MMYRIYPFASSAVERRKHSLCLDCARYERVEK